MQIYIYFWYICTMNKERILRKFEVSEKCELLSFLLVSLKDCSRTTVKSYLAHRNVLINNTITTKFNAPLRPGDEVVITRGRGAEDFKNPMMRIVYEDEHIIVIDKKNGLLSMATNKERIKTAYSFLSTHVKKSNPENRIFIVHRLDRETSGLMLFARSEKVQELFQRNWTDAVLERKYVAVVEGKMPKDEGVIEAKLKQSTALKMYVPFEGEEGENAITHYKVLKVKNNHSLVELELETGKKNQIRAHLEYVHAPISGDKKYGAKLSPAGRVCLHASKLFIKHPISGEELNFSTKIPANFEAVVK